MRTTFVLSASLARPEKAMFLGSVLLVLVGCDGQPRANREPGPGTSTPSAELPEIAAESEEGFVDLMFRVEEHKLLTDGSQSIRVAAFHKGRKVGFEVVLGSSWKKGKLGKDLPIETSQGTVSYRRTGPESDAFIQVLDGLYGAKLNPNAMAAQTLFTAITLGGDPVDLASGPVKIKLFYEKGGDDRYAELFTKIDLAARKLEVAEKDEEYRSQIVQALKAE
jgi:hypothetical protein